MPLFAGIGLGLSALGGLLKSKGQNKAMRQAAAAAEFKPYNMFGPGGSTTFNGQNINQRLSGDMQAFNDMFAGQGLGLLGGQGGNQQFVDYANAVGNQQLPGLFQGALAQSQQLPGQAAGQFGQFSQQNAMGAQGMGFGALGQAMSGGGQNEGIARGLFQQGFGALGNTNFDQLAQQQVAAQRAFARPGEERAVNSKFQNLFNTGQLEATGGQRQIGDLAQAQEMADIQRVNSAQQFANQLGQQNRAFGLGAIGQGLGARQQDVNQNMQMGQLGMGLMNFGQQAAGQGFDSAMAFSNLGNQRAQQRLQNANQMFGFGQQAGQQNINQALQMFGGMQGINSDMRQQAALAGNIASARAGAGANQGKYLSQTGGSPFGSFLSGFGGGMNIFDGS